MKIIIIITSLAILGCFEKINKIKYYEAIIGVESRTGELVTPGTLFYDTTFLNIFKHPNLYKEDAIAFLAKPTYTEQQKLISVFSMQNLDVNNYIDYTKECYALYKQNSISPNVLRFIILSDIKGDNLNRVYKDTLIPT